MGAQQTGGSVGGSSRTGGRRTTRRGYVTAGTAVALSIVAGCTESDDPSGVDGGTDSPAGSDATATDPADDTPTETETEGSDGGGFDGGVPTLAESHAMEGEMTDAEGRVVEVYGEVDGSDFYVNFVPSSSDGEFELYVVDGDMYNVNPNGCVLIPDVESAGFMGMTVDVSGSEEYDYRRSEFWTDRTPDRSESYDGEEMYVYEHTVEYTTTVYAPESGGEETVEVSYDRTLYVSRETGYVRRQEEFHPDEGARVDVRLFDWDAGFDIGPPEVDCEEF